MGRWRKRSLVWLRDVPPFHCAFGCGRSLESKYSWEAANDWDWFTGYGDGPIHFCPTCRRTRQYEIDRIRQQANLKPRDYPDTRIELAKLVAGER